MSYLRKGLRQSQDKNVIEREFVTKTEYYSPNENDFRNRTSVERKMESIVDKNYRKTLSSNWIHFGSIKRNDQYRNTDYTRNYNNCLDTKGNLIQLNPSTDKDWSEWNLVPLSQVRNSKMFRIYGNEDKIYHLTSLQHWNQIRVHGLVNRNKNHTYYERGGRMYFVQSDDIKILNSIGFGQIVGGQNNLPIVVLEIDKKGITGDLFGEEGNEFVTPLHLVLTNQKRIKPEFIKYYKTFHTNMLKYYHDREELGRLKQEYFSEIMNVDINQISMMGLDFDVENDSRYGNVIRNPSTRKISHQIGLYQSNSKDTISTIPYQDMTRETEFKLVS